MVLYPAVELIRASFNRYSITGLFQRSVGLDNYARLLEQDALPNARLAPTTDPTWDRVKVDVQQSIGLAVQPGGDPKQVLERLQKNALAAGGTR